MFCAECGGREPGRAAGDDSRQEWDTDFNASMRKQRSSLLETNINGVKTIFGFRDGAETCPGSAWVLLCV